MPNLSFHDFIKKHQLPESYIQVIETLFMPLAIELANYQQKVARPVIVGINGAQGSGKSTLADLLVYLLNTKHSLNAVALSIDDFYFNSSDRNELAKTIHPLLATRGVPGTHDIALAMNTISSLCHSGMTQLPRFIKAIDEPVPNKDREVALGPVDIILLEGWCLGADSQQADDLLKPINELEEKEDAQSVWRHYVNLQLTNNYPILFNQIDKWIMLKAPSFDCVFKWRLEQENKLRTAWLSKDDQNQIMDEESLKRFIMFYQRITQHVLKTLPAKVDYLFELDDNRIIQNSR